MNDLMKAEIEAAIKKSLPSEVGAALAGELQRLAKLEEETKSRQEQVAILSEQVKELRAKEMSAREMAIRESVVTKRELDVEKRERQFEIELLKAEVDKAKAVSVAVVDLVRLLVRNTEMRSSVYQTGNQGVAVPQGHYVTSVPTNHSDTRTLTTE